MTRSVRSTTVVAGAALLLAACEPGTHVAEAGAIDTGRIVRARPAVVTPPQWRCVRALYERTNGLPVWLDTTGTDERARSLVRELTAAADSRRVREAPAAVAARAPFGAAGA